MPGARPQSGMMETPLATARSCSFFCSRTISVLPPRSEKWQPLSSAASAMGPL